jgi:hypothetical protein
MWKTVIADLDGTLADNAARLHYIVNLPPERRDWAAFHSACFSDQPNPAVEELLRMFAQSGYQIVLCTGRPNTYRLLTEKWLDAYHIPWHQLLMRPEGNTESDTIIKPRLVADFHAPSDVLVIIEDRTKVVRRFRELGYTVLQCAEGDF